MKSKEIVERLKKIREKVQETRYGCALVALNNLIRELEEKCTEY